MRRAVVLVPILLLAACGDDDGGTVDAGSGDPVTTAAPDTETTETTETTVNGILPGDHVELLQLGESFGMCAGYCERAISIDGDVLTFTATDRNEPEPSTATGRLTENGATALDSAAAALLGFEVEETYGCPDCADGGASFVEFDDGISIRRSTYENPNPPTELAEVHELATELLDAFGSCASNDLVTIDEGCTPIA